LWVLQHIEVGNSLFAVPCKLRNERRDRFVDVELVTLRQQVNEHRRDGLGAREEVEERLGCRAH
jgi:hypothetical protein